MCDFNLSQIKVIQNLFPECKLNTCFFHFSQAIWRNFKKYQLTGINTYDNNRKLLFNIQIMNFIERDKIDKYFIELKKEFRHNKYKNFFNYFSRTWLGTRGSHITFFPTASLVSFPPVILFFPTCY